MDYVLKTSKLTKAFPGKLAVDQVSLGVRKGDIYGLIGQNGAGKTTVLRMVSGLAAPTSGEIALFGSPDLVGQRHRIGTIFENPTLFPGMTALDNMKAQSLLLRGSGQGCAELLDLAGISDTGNRKVKHFSLGMKQRLMIALALLGAPDFLVLDEPTNGLDPIAIKETLALLLRLNRENGLTVLLSSHILGQLEQVATRYGVIRQGRLVAELGSDELGDRLDKHLVVEVTDPDRAQAVVKGLLPGAEVSRDARGALCVTGHLDLAGEINTRLVQAGLQVSGLTPRVEKLDTFLTGIMEGKTHA